MVGGLSKESCQYLVWEGGALFEGLLILGSGKADVGQFHMRSHTENTEADAQD